MAMLELHWPDLKYTMCSLHVIMYALVVNNFEHDLTMDVLLENCLSDIRCCYHSNIYQRHTAEGEAVTAC